MRGLNGFIAVGVAVLIGAIAGAVTPSAGAGGGTFGSQGVLYAAAGGGAASNLYSVDSSTGTATAIGPTGVALTGLAVDPTTGIMYGATTPNSPVSPLSLVTINTTTGAATLVGSFALQVGGSAIADLAFNASGQLYGWEEGPDDLASINKSTGAATVVGPSGFSTAGDGESFDSNGVLWDMSKGETGALWNVNTTTGAVTTVATLSNSPNGSGDMNAATFGCDGATLWAIDGGDHGAGSPSWLVTVNTSTGVMTSHGHSNINNLDGLTWKCTTPSTASPRTPGEYCTPQPVKRADGTYGRFVDLVQGQNLTDPTYAGATPAYYGQGYGLTCDSLLARGFTDAGYKVDLLGHHNGNSNEIYEYYTK